MNYTTNHPPPATTGLCKVRGSANHSLQTMNIGLEKRKQVPSRHILQYVKWRVGWDSSWAEKRNQRAAKRNQRAAERGSRGLAANDFFCACIFAFARCCFCIAASLLVFTSPMRVTSLSMPFGIAFRGPLNHIDTFCISGYEFYNHFGLVV